MSKLADSRRFSKTVAGLGLIVGSILLVISNVVAPAWAGDHTAKYLQQVADNQGAHLASALTGLVGALLLIPGLMGVSHLLRDRRVGIGEIGAALFALGVVMSAGLFVFAAVDIGMVDPGADRAQMIALSDRAEESAASSVFFLLFVAGFVLGGILLAVGLWRRRAVPAWVAILLVVGSALGASQMVDEQVLTVIAVGVLAVAFGAIGMKLLSLSDEEWGRWRVLPERAEAGEGA